MAKLLYPLLVLHMGIILMAIPPAVLNGGFSTFFKAVIPALLGIYLLAGLLVFGGMFLLRQLARSTVLARLFLGVPILGRFFQNWSGWNFSLVLSFHIRTGGSLLESFEMAADACGNAALASAAARAMAGVQKGEGLSEAFGRDQVVVPELLLRALTVGEHAGRLDEESERAADLFNQRVLGQLNMLAEWLPRLFYLLVMLFTAWQIFQMVGSINDSVSTLLAPE